MKKIIDPEETKDGIEIVRCGDTFQMLGKSFVQDGVRYFMPICPHTDTYTTVRGTYCNICNSKIR